MSEDDSSPGWDAITDRCREVHGDQEPRHFGTIIRWSLGGPDPLDGLSAYAVEDPLPHWHVIGYGLSELFAKDSPDPELSGWGIELTIRVRREPDEAEPPMWALTFLQNLARYVATTGNVLEAGHHLDANGPIALGVATDLTGVVLTEDPQLGTVDTPHGRLTFVQVVGVTADELAAKGRWTADGLLGLVAERAPLHVIDLARTTVLDSPAQLQRVEDGIARDGSSTGFLFIDALDLHPGTPHLVLGAVAVRGMRGLVAGRLLHGRTLLLAGTDLSVGLHPGQANAVSQAEDGHWRLELTPDAARWLSDRLPARAGVYAPPECSPLVVEVEVSHITDRSGAVVSTVGD